MRCLNFADYLQERGVEVNFICRDLKGNIAHIIRDRGYQVDLLPEDKDFVPEANPELFHQNWLETSQENDARIVSEMLRVSSPDWIIVDHYALDRRWQHHLKEETGCKILVIDDLADRQHDSEILLDQNFRKNKELYQDLVPSHCVQFIGPEYALLKQEFFSLRKKEKHHENPENLFIFFSGIDQKGMTLRVLKALERVPYQFKNIDIVCGSRNPFLDEIKEVANAKENYNLHVDTNEMARLIANADLAIGAGGVNTWERCFLHVPTLVASIAENQEKISQDCDEVGYLKYIGRSEEVSDKVLEEEIRNFVSDISVRGSIEDKLKCDFAISGLNEVMDFIMNNIEKNRHGHREI